MHCSMFFMKFTMKQMMNSDEKRSYLRMAVPGLKVRYNVFETEIFNAVPRLPRPKEAYTLLPNGGETLEPVFQLMLERLERIEMKLDYILRMMGRGVEERLFQYESMVQDISGGGLSFTHHESISTGKYLELCVYSAVGDMSPIFAVGKVCRVEFKEKEKCYLLGVEFSDIYEEDRQTIIRMVFDVERKLRRRVNINGSYSENPQ